MRSLHESADEDRRSGITLALEGSSGSSSVELSGEDCAALAEAAALYASGESTVPLDRLLLERFAADSPVARWTHLALAGFARDAGGFTAGLPGDEIESMRVGAWLLERLAGSLGESSPPTGSPAATLMRRVVDLGVVACRQRLDVDRRIVEARIESMKQLAYGAGHEINNPLANIATRAQSLVSGERDPDRRRRLAAIIDQAFRARDMIGGLMLFARPPKPVRGEVTLQSVVASAVAAVESAATARGIRLRLDSDQRPPMSGIWDRSQLEEAVRAVVLNAIEAGSDGGEVMVAVESAGDSSRCRVRVVDDGPGMDRDTLANAFDPFFSGREAGRGIGLGLSKAWRLVEVNGGRTSIESRHGVGTTVSIELPLALDECSRGTARDASARP